ncbi:MAG: zf-TFIIB domain-containing protein [Acidobacteriota bacterium]|nr:zf-TFIIB domain-containing protein [Acidobacteriota bacterium]
MSDGFDERRRGLEEEYFRRKEQEALEKLRAGKSEAGQEQSEAPDAATTALTCPRCHVPLIEITYADVKIDRCNNCKGWWLDAGELEQLTTRDDPGWFSRLRQTFSSERG